MPSDWNGCIREVNYMYVHLCEHFDDMLDGDRVRHFNIDCGDMSMWGYYEEVAEKYGEEIHRDLVPWIREEARSGQIFQSSNWKPFRKPYLYTSCYAGYRKFFQYGKYTFQLTMILDKDWNEQGVREDWICFEVALYGQDSIYELDDNGMISERRWRRM